MIRTLIVGGDHVGGRLAARLAHVDVVGFLDDEFPVSETEAEVVGREVDITDRRQLEQVGLDDVETVVVASERDSVNLLVSQLLRTTFDVDRVVVRINDPQNRAPFEETGVETVCVADALSRALEDAVVRDDEDAVDDAVVRDDEDAVDVGTGNGDSTASRVDGTVEVDATVEDGVRRRKA